MIRSILFLASILLPSYNASASDRVCRLVIQSALPDPTAIAISQNKIWGAIATSAGARESFPTKTVHPFKIENGVAVLLDSVGDQIGPLIHLDMDERGDRLFAVSPAAGHIFDRKGERFLPRNSFTPHRGTPLVMRLVGENGQWAVGIFDNARAVIFQIESDNHRPGVDLELDSELKLVAADVIVRTLFGPEFAVVGIVVPRNPAKKALSPRAMVWNDHGRLVSTIPLPNLNWQQKLRVKAERIRGRGDIAVLVGPMSGGPNTTDELHVFGTSLPPIAVPHGQVAELSSGGYAIQTGQNFIATKDLDNAEAKVETADSVSAIKTWEGTYGTEVYFVLKNGDLFSWAPYP